MFTHKDESNCLTVLAQMTLALVVAGSVAIGTTSHCVAQVREVARFALGDVAQATTDRLGRPVVAFNPAACARLGPEMCEFVRAHEYGHIAMGHLYDGTPDRQAEAEADCWAAKNASPGAVRAASNYFNNGYFGSSIHGSGPQRARRVAGCQSRGKRVTVRRARPAAGRTVSTRSATPRVVRTFSTTPTSRRVVRKIPEQSATTRVVRNVRPPTARPVRTVSTRPKTVRAFAPRTVETSVKRTLTAIPVQPVRVTRSTR